MKIINWGFRLIARDIFFLQGAGGKVQETPGTAKSISKEKKSSFKEQEKQVYNASFTLEKFKSATKLFKNKQKKEDLKG